VRTATAALLLLFGFSIWQESRSADIRSERSELFLHTYIYVRGQISAKDYSVIRRGLEEAAREARAQSLIWSQPILVLDSLGGDVAAAMQIGRLARKTKASAWIPKGECSSACVLVLAGATGRIIAPDSRVGIHRTFFEGLPASMTYDQVRELMRKNERLIADYLEEMDIPRSLLDEMKSVPPGEVRYLSEPELRRFRLSGTDPATQELSESRRASDLGISRQEYNRRSAQAERECRSAFRVSGQAWARCYEDVMNGRR
jgi:hypothetical protein